MCIRDRLYIALSTTFIPPYPPERGTSHHETNALLIRASLVMFARPVFAAGDSSASCCRSLAAQLSGTTNPTRRHACCRRNLLRPLLAPRCPDRRNGEVESDSFCTDHPQWNFCRSALRLPRRNL